MMHSITQSFVYRLIHYLLYKSLQNMIDGEYDSLH
jgi:hypothetical protein